MRYLVMHIGCLECGEPTHVMGIYPTREEAESHIPGRKRNPPVDDGKYPSFFRDSTTYQVFDLTDSNTYECEWVECLDYQVKGMT